MTKARAADQKYAPVTIVLKLRPDLSTQSADLVGHEKQLRALLKDSSLELRPLIESVTTERLAELVKRARRADAAFDREPADFSRWYKAVTPDAADVDERINDVRRIGIFETAYVMRALPPPVNPTGDPLYVDQGYLGPATSNGIDAAYAWNFADGSGTSFVDVEEGWNLNHEDLVAAGITEISGLNWTEYSHGTAVLGVLCMQDNGLGGVGIAPKSSGRVVSHQRPAVGTTPAHTNRPEAIIDAASTMGFGDVLLIEAQAMDPVLSSPPKYLPVEFEEPVYQAIRLATALGIVVVEPSCNSGLDLHDYPTLNSRDDSGAIVVGAADSSSLERCLFSNYGSRVDCFAWGNNIVTASTDGTGTHNDVYVPNQRPSPDGPRVAFGGTSGAAAIVAGAALLVQGMAQAALGYRFGPRALRRLLVANGTLSKNGTPSNPTADGIGLMPDLRAIISGNELNLAPDVYLRDYVGDTGDLTSGMVSQSPDIIVRRTSVGNPQAAFGAGSGTENDPALSDDVDPAQDHFVYVRLLNRGGSAAAPVDVDVYWSLPATLLAPHLWNLLGSVTVPSVPTGNVLTVSYPMTWPSNAIPSPGHYCFVAIAGNAEDPRPGPTTFHTFDQYVAFIERNNNVAWRNFAVMPDPSSPGLQSDDYELPFLIAGAFDTSHVFDLEVLGRLPAGSRAYLDTPESLADLLRPHTNEIAVDAETRWTRIPLRTAGTQRLGSAELEAKSASRCKLRVQIPKDESKRHAHEIAIRQLYREVEVGRMTWRLGGPRGR